MPAYSNIHISPNLKCGSYHFPHCSAYNCTLIVSQECCFVYYFMLSWSLTTLSHVINYYIYCNHSVFIPKLVDSINVSSARHPSYKFYNGLLIYPN